MSESSDKACSLLSEIGDISHRCTGRRQHYTLDGRVFRSYRLFLEAVFKKPLAGIMYNLYIEHEMSSLDIHQAFSEVFGFTLSSRVISILLKESGVKIRDRAETKALSWKQGKMAGSMAKSRQSRKKTYLLGSKAEHKVRYLLREALLVLDVDWDVIIGDHLQHILDRFEVDIPLVIVDRQTSNACRIAVEIDNTFTHSGKTRQKRDARKDAALKKAGWHVIRINGEQFRKKSVLAEEVSDLALQVEQLAEETFLNQNFPGGRCE